MKKKIMSLIIIAIGVLSLSACGSEDKKELVMATNAEFPPYEFHEGQKIVGIDVEIAKAIAKEMDAKLKIEDMGFNAILTAVQSGKADIGLAGMTVTEDRLASVDFSDPYTTSTQVIIVKEDSPINSPDDLTGKKIGGQIGTTGVQYAKSEVKDAKVEEYNKGFEAVQALSQGKIDAVIIDVNPAKKFVAKTEGLRIIDEEFTKEDYAIAVKKGNTELLEQLNKVIAELKKSGKLAKIEAKYIKAK